MPASALTFASVCELRDLLARREVSSRELVDAHLARIEEVNPHINAVVALCAERARREADDADARTVGDPRRPLHGIPMTMKDTFDTAGVVSTWGTLGRANKIPSHDATVVARLRQAGAILLGKSNTPELTLSFHTFNRIYGVTVNPYDLERTAGGSSGGAAAIIAAGGAPFDLGTDTGGSIRLPAHFCGVAGIRPTSGRVPRTGHAIGPGGPLDSLTQIGPMARYVGDLALLLPIISGPDDSDPSIPPVPLGDVAAVDISRLRVAFYVDNGLYTPTDAIVQAVRQSAVALDEAGAQVDERLPPGVERTMELYGGLLDYDGGAWGRLLLKRAGTRFKDNTIWRPGESDAPSYKEQAELFADWQAFRQTMLGFMRDYDIIVSPVNGTAAFRFAEPMRYAAFSYTMTYNLTGWPGVVVRVGAAPEEQGSMPIGVQVVAKPWHEHVALAVAAHLEARFGGYQRPPGL